MTALPSLAVKIFADGANLADMLALAAQPHIAGFTTNPTLMRQAGVRSYRAFARELIAEIGDKPLCFEVLADEFDEMERQAQEIASWGANVYVKIPVMNTRREPCYESVRRLTARGVRVNVTAVLTLAQVREVAAALDGGTESFVSIFAGRIADTGVDPVPVMASALELLAGNERTQLIWASTRELYNIFQAASVGCDIITVTHDLLRKLPLIGRDLTDYSRETVAMFFNDSRAAGFTL